MSDLCEPTPDVLKNVSFVQHSLRVLEFGKVLDHERIVSLSADITRLAFHPGHRFEHMVTPDFNIGRRELCRTAAEEDVFPGRFQEIVDDFVRATRKVANPPSDSVRISAGTDS